MDLSEDANGFWLTRGGVVFISLNGWRRIHDHHKGILSCLMSERKTLKYFLLKSTVSAILDGEETWLVLEFIRRLCLKVCLHLEKLIAVRKEWMLLSWKKYVCNNLYMLHPIEAHCSVKHEFTEKTVCIMYNGKYTALTSTELFMQDSLALAFIEVNHLFSLCLRKWSCLLL